MCILRVGHIHGNGGTRLSLLSSFQPVVLEKRPWMLASCTAHKVVTSRVWVADCTSST